MEITKRKDTTTLSRLSDDLLLRILGHLETLDAVRTCVLSRRWRNLWKYLPSISFSQLHFSLIDSPKRGRSFSDLLTQVLLRRHHSDLDKFRLRIYFKIDPYLVESSLEYAIKHNVKFIDVGVGKYGYQRGVVFPQCFFDSPSLQGLELRYECYDCIRWPPHLNWPALRSLYLENFILGKSNFDGRIFSSCPSLETLQVVSLQTDRDLKDKTFYIHSLSLRSLQLVYFNFERHFLSAYMIVIVAPKLTTFQFSGYWPVICSVDAPSLENVTINLRPQTDGAFSSSQVCFYENARETVLRSIKMVNEFRLAKSLSITVKTIEVLAALPDLLEEHLTKFENLKDLKLMTPVPLQPGKCFSISPRILSYFISPSTAFKLECVKATLW